LVWCFAYKTCNLCAYTCHIVYKQQDRKCLKFEIDLQKPSFRRWLTKSVTKVFEQADESLIKLIP
jgi:hypothetical protein